MKDKIETCFISAPAGASLSKLREALDEREIQVLTPQEAPIGSEYSAEISRIISEVDLVIGILTRERRSDAILFELGQAWAQERQVLLFAPPKFTTFSFDLKRFLVIRTSLANKKTISFALDQVAAAPKSGKSPSHVRRPKLAGLGQKYIVFQDDVRQAVYANEYQIIEKIAATVIQESGIDIIAEAAVSEGSADLAIWSDALQTSVGNPIVVEVKLRIIGSAEAKKAAHQLSRAIADSGASWGLLLYGEGPSDEKTWRSLPANVLSLSLPSLIRQMEDRSFADVVRDLRNQRVHGVRP